MDDPPGACPEAATNKEKSWAFIHVMFPAKPPGLLAPENYRYPAPLTPSGTITEDQIRRHIDKLSPYKATGTDNIPNVILKESADVILPYLKQIFRAIFLFFLFFKSFY